MSWEFPLCRQVPRLDSHPLIGITDSETVGPRQWPWWYRRRLHKRHMELEDRLPCPGTVYASFLAHSLVPTRQNSVKKPVPAHRWAGFNHSSGFLGIFHSHLSPVAAVGGPHNRRQRCPLDSPSGICVSASRGNLVLRVYIRGAKDCARTHSSPALLARSYYIVCVLDPLLIPVSRLRPYLLHSYLLSSPRRLNNTSRRCADTIQYRISYWLASSRYHNNQNWKVQAPP